MNKWDKLSMHQKADLMKIYVKGGITNIGDIRKHYNRFGDGGDKNNSNSNSKVDSQSSKEWLTNWVTNRPLEQMAQQQLKDISEQKQWYQSDDPSIQKLNLQESLLRDANSRKEHIEELLGRTQEFTVGDIIDNYNSSPLYTALGARIAAEARKNMGRRESFTIDLGKGTSESNSYTTKDYLEHFDDSRIKGVTFTTPNTNSGFYRNPTIVYSNKHFNSPSTQIHELNHVLHSPKQGIYNAMGLNKGLVKDVNVNLNTGYSNDNYLDSLEEVHSRIMQVRKAAGLSPEKFNYTPEEAKSIIRDYGEGLNLDRYTPETLSEFLNNFAYNTRVAAESNTNKRVAKYGGALNKFKLGGQTENDFNGINPFTNNSVFNSKKDEKAPLLREEDLPFEYKYYPLSLEYNRPWYNETIDNYGVQKLIAKDKNGKYYGLNPKYEKYLNRDGLKLVTKEELKQKRKDIDYIGGTEEEVAVKMLNKLPKLQNLVDSLSNVYGVDNNVLYERLAQEGLLSRYANIYNVLPAKRQKDGSIEKELFSPGGVDAFHDLGLDTAGEHLEKGHYNMRWINPELGYGTVEIKNEKGKLQTSVEVPNIQSGIEILAAHAEYLQNKAKRKKPTSTKAHINNTVNTMYNIGEYHKDVMDSTFVDSKYPVTNWKKLLNK